MYSLRSLLPISSVPKMILVPENKKGDKFESFHPRRTWEKPQNSSFSWEIGFRISIFGYRAIV